MSKIVLCDIDGTIANNDHRQHYLEGKKDWDGFFSELINEDHTFISKDKILEKFKSFKFDHDKNIVFSCGSGVTASVLALAYSLINAKYMPTIYDGSWAEYGKINL